MTLTIDDLRKPQNLSGFAHVAYGPAGSSTRPFFAEVYAGHRPEWRGPRRATAEEAAQDYCDYMNGRDAATQEHRIRLAPGRPDLYARPNGEWFRGEGRARASESPIVQFSRRVSETLHPERRFAFEKDLEDALVPVVRQLAEEIGQAVLCEVKNDTGRQAIATAVGQLALRQAELWQEDEYPALAIGVPESLRPDLAKIVDTLGIQVLVP